VQVLLIVVKSFLNVVFYSCVDLLMFRIYRFDLGLFLVIFLLVLGSIACGPDGVYWPTKEILYSIRLPQVCLAFLVGAGLALSGVVCQVLLHNALADAYVLGLSGGAALGGTVFSLLMPFLSLDVKILLTVLSAWGSLFFLLVRRSFITSSVLLLFGIVFNTLCSAIITFLKLIVSSQEAQSLLYWLVGYIPIYEYKYIFCLAVAVIMSGVLFCYESPKLDVLSLGDDVAWSLGVDSFLLRRRLYVGLTLLVGVIVALVGLVGFVGLMVPHALRLTAKPHTHRRFLLESALLGGGLLVVSDALCRLCFIWVHSEVPVGVMMTFLGAPYLLVMLLRSSGGVAVAP